MKKHRIIYFVLAPLIFLAVSFGAANEGWAVEEGGRVQTNAGIVFRKADPSTEQTSDSAHNRSSSKEKKQINRLPNTGDLIMISLLITGCVLILIVLIFFFWKKRTMKGAHD